MCTLYPKFVLTGVISIEKALKGTEVQTCILRIKRKFVLTRFRNIN